MPIVKASFWKEEYMSVHKSITSSKELIEIAQEAGFSTVNVNALPDLYYSKRLIFKKIQYPTNLYILKLFFLVIHENTNLSKYHY